MLAFPTGLFLYRHDGATPLHYGGHTKCKECYTLWHFHFQLFSFLFEGLVTSGMSTARKSHKRSTWHQKWLSTPLYTYVYIYKYHVKLGDNVWQMWYLVSSSWGDQAAGLPVLSSPGGKKKRRPGSQATRMFKEWWIKLGNLAGLCWISRPTHDNLTPLFSRKKNISLNCHKILWVKDYQIPSFEALQHVTWRKTMD